MFSVATLWKPFLVICSGGVHTKGSCPRGRNQPPELGPLACQRHDGGLLGTPCTMVGRVRGGPLAGEGGRLAKCPCQDRQMGIQPESSRCPPGPGQGGAGCCTGDPSAGKRRCAHEPTRQSNTPGGKLRGTDARTRWPFGSPGGRVGQTTPRRGSSWGGWAGWVATLGALAPRAGSSLR